MLPNTQYYTEDGIQLSMYFMEVMGITQGMEAGISHKARKAIDESGRGVGIDSAYAPFDCKIVWKKPTRPQTGILITNTRKVLTPKGLFDPYKINVLFWHDNNTKDLDVGMEIKQGQRFYEEGTAGNATGNHIHYMTSTVKYDGTYPLYRTWANNWALKNQTSPVELFFVNDTVLRKTFGYNWKTYNGKILNSPIVQTAIKTYYTVQKGDTLSKIASKYKTTWQKIYQANIDLIGKNPSAIKIGMKILIP